MINRIRTAVRGAHTAPALGRPAALVNAGDPDTDDPPLLHTDEADARAPTQRPAILWPISP